MLRMIQSQSAEQAKDYHNNALAPSDYYLDEQELKGAFRGRIAKRLGIEGDAEKFAFDALCDNINPVTLEKLTARNVKDRTVGYDINFHCPKSVSVLHVLSKDGHILDAFHQAVRETMDDIEADSKTRVRRKGKDTDRDTGELIWGEFIHQTARPVADAEPDPHLHAHCFTFNVTWDKEEQRYKAGQFQGIKRDMPYYEARFHKKLADKLVALGGYQVRRTKTSFEVVGVPNQVIDLFSKRTNEIGQIAKKENIINAKELDKIGARSRAKKKKGLTMAQLKQEWIRQIRAAGLADNGGRDLLRHDPATKLESVSPGECVDHALLHRFERVSVAQDRRVLESAYRFALGHVGTSLDQITKQFGKDRRIIRVKDGSRMMCTTKEVLAEERRMVELAQAGRGKMIPLYRSAPSLSFQGDQEAAACRVLTSPDRVAAIVRGGAGTGKTTLLKETVARINDVGKQVIVVAPTAQASRGVLRDEGFKDAETVAKLLTDPALQERLAGNVLWVDEAGLLGTKEMTALLELTERYDARLVLAGDVRQHAAVVRGDALRVLETIAGIVPATVNKIYRQKSQQYRDAVQDLADGNVKRAFARLDALGSVKKTDPAQPLDGLVADYVSALQSGRSALVISPTHRQGEQVIDAIRGKLRSLGKLGKKETTVTRLVNLNLSEAEKTEAFRYEPGHVLQFNQNRPGIVRGSRWSVASATSKELTIQNGDGKTAKFPLLESRYYDVFRAEDMRLASGDKIRITRNGFAQDKSRLNNGQMLEVLAVNKKGIQAKNTANEIEYMIPLEFGHLAHAYCITSHASQGKTVDEVFISQPAATFPATSRQQFYVSVSRGRERVHIYTEDKEALLDHVAQSGDRVGALELFGPGKNPLAFKMIRRRKDQLVTSPRPVEPSPKQIMKPHAPKLVP
ncbi:MobF family relaxase [Flavitalea sp. BT771]|uniref:MobF family relaxase n=1 Tax=Flavitalea sp. BT771 TaxID=3063329 RepID=UPI0026E3A346|nr:MobF family relaxase [Flavitalea sp. BT771]MDO6430905.1 MobF family relaxase [Flavitalea sp. BT771]MDV6218955.1 MobF family relaxase [Flavitalea sp. BT771]